MLASAGGDKGALSHLSSFQRENPRHPTRDIAPAHGATHTDSDGPPSLPRASLRAIVLPLAALSFSPHGRHGIGLEV